MELLYCLPTAESTADVISDCAVDKIKKVTKSFLFLANPRNG